MFVLVLECHFSANMKSKAFLLLLMTQVSLSQLTQARKIDFESASIENYSFFTLLDAVHDSNDPRVGKWHSRKCVGSIIDIQWVVTGRSCVDDVICMKLYMGIDDFSQKENAVVRTVSKIFYPEAKEGGLLYEMALVKLDAPLIFSKAINAVSLPKRDEEKEYLNKTVELLGFNDHLNKLKITLYEYKECVKKARLMFDEGDRYTCSWYEGHYVRDRGAPVVVKKGDGTNVIISLISTGPSGSGRKEMFLLETISPYLEWVKNITSNN